jgi:hypothetical protein
VRPCEGAEGALNHAPCRIISLAGAYLLKHVPSHRGKQEAKDLLIHGNPILVCWIWGLDLLVTFMCVEKLIWHLGGAGEVAFKSCTSYDGEHLRLS